MEESDVVPGRLRRLDSSEAGMQARAIGCFEKSLRLAPNLASPYQSLVAIHMAGEQPEKVAETYRRLLEHLPDDLDALLFLAQHHIRRDEPFLAREFALRAHRLKPSNREISVLLWSVHVGSARHFALRGEWEKGRAEFEAADNADPTARDAYHLLARRAVFELKARHFEAGEQLAERAQSRLEEPTTALLALAVEAARYDLSRTATTGFERQWKAALKKKCRSQTAGLMCLAMTAYLEVEVDYPGRSSHLKHVLAYVRRCSRVKWQAGDLRNVCAFLETVIDGDVFPNESRLLEKLVHKGLKKFPKEPAFLVVAAELEIGKGPVRCDRRYAHWCLEQALELMKNADGPEDAELAERAKRKLTFLGEVGLEPDDDYDYDDDDYDDDDEEDEEFAFSGPPPIDGFDDGDGPFSDFPPGELFRMFVRACREMGLDPEEVLDDAAAGGPPGIRLPKRRSRSKRKNKR